MTTLTAPSLMTTDELLALPENGTDRWLIDGHLRARPMTIRNRFYSRIMARVVFLLEAWLEPQSSPRGQVLCGEVGVRLRRDPDSTIGVDVICVPPEVVAQQTEETTLIDGVPVLAVEILSASEVLEDIHEKIEAFLRAGVKLVCIIDPYDRTVRIYRPGEQPVLVNLLQELTAEPHLPGFRVPFARLFD